MNLNKKEVIQAMCDLVSLVGSEIFKCKVSHDCFCDKSAISNPEINIEIIEWIRTLIQLEIENRK